MNSPEFIRSKLVNRTNADCSEQEVKNNRFHYYLRFDESIGWDWMYGQIQKTQMEIERGIELWEIHPSGVQSFEVEVREIDRRPDIDESQSGFGDFES